MPNGYGMFSASTIKLSHSFDMLKLFRAGITNDI